MSAQYIRRREQKGDFGQRDSVAFLSAPPEIENLLLCIGFRSSLLAWINTSEDFWLTLLRVLFCSDRSVCCVDLCRTHFSLTPLYHCIDEKGAPSEQTENLWKATTIRGQIHLTKNLCCVLARCVRYNKGGRWVIMDKWGIVSNAGGKDCQ